MQMETSKKQTEITGNKHGTFIMVGWTVMKKITQKNVAAIFQTEPQ